MSKLDDWAAQQWAGLSQGAGDVARGAWADIGNSYMQILTQDASIGPPTPVMGDMVATHDPALPEPASDAELQALIDAHAIAELAETAQLEHDIAAPEPEADMEPQYG